MKDVHFNFEDLKLYQKALDFTDFAYDLAMKFPSWENYGLRSQLTRASVSITLNCSEGSGDTDLQFNRYLEIVSDSIRECVACTTIAFRRHYISQEENIKARNMLLELLKMTRGLQRYLKSKSKK